MADGRAQEGGLEMEREGERDEYIDNQQVTENF